MDEIDQLPMWRPISLEEDFWEADARRDRWGWLRSWTLVYVLNLPVCLFFGWAATRELARPGMFLGILILHGLGALACSKWRFLHPPLVLGGGLVALAQFAPMLQILAGVRGTGLAMRVSGLYGLPLTSPDDLYRVDSGLIATLGTGGLLMTAALVIGVFGCFITRGPWWLETDRDGSMGKKPIPDDLHDFQ